MNDHIHPPDPELVHRLVRHALEEDRAFSDVTTHALIPGDQRGTAAVLFRVPGVVCGMDVFVESLRLCSSAIEVEVLAADGSSIEAGQIAATVRGPLAPILSAERVGLNFLQRLSGIATLTRRMVDRAAEGGPADVTDTRKTTPGLRTLERYAIRVGGGRNHRDTLADGILIKDNHIAAAAKRGVGLGELVAEARRRAPHTLRVEIEVTDTAMALVAFAAEPDVILLDNMPLDQMRRIVEAAPDGLLLEASGGVTLETVREIAATGVHLVSSGALTHSAPALDIALEVEAL